MRHTALTNGIDLKDLPEKTDDLIEESENAVLMEHTITTLCCIRQFSQTSQMSTIAIDIWIA